MSHIDDSGCTCLHANEDHQDPTGCGVEKCRCTWRYRPHNVHAHELLRAFREHDEEPFGPPAVQERFGVSRDAAYAILSRMTRAGALRRLRPGDYVVVL